MRKLAPLGAGLLIALAVAGPAVAQPNGIQFACYDNGVGDCTDINGSGVVITSGTDEQTFEQWSGNHNHLQENGTNDCIKWIPSVDQFQMHGCANGQPAEAFTYVSLGGGVEEIKSTGDGGECLTGKGNNAFLQAGVCTGTSTRWVWK